MTLSKSQINKLALQELQRRYCEVWLQSNARTVKGYTFKGRKGVPDIIGFNINTGLFVGCEVKTLNDTMSDEQHELLAALRESGAIALVATEDKRTGNMMIMDYYDYKYAIKPGRHRKLDPG